MQSKLNRFGNNYYNIQKHTKFKIEYIGISAFFQNAMETLAFDEEDNKFEKNSQISLPNELQKCMFFLGY